jgi:hypothetical protein
MECSIPTTAMLRNTPFEYLAITAYEGDWPFYFYLQPAKFHPSVEAVVECAWRKLLRQVA